MAIQLLDGIRINQNQKGFLGLDEDILKKLIIKEPICNFYNVEPSPFARGKFAAVKKCTHKETGVEYAAKFIRKRRRVLDHTAENIYHEIAVLQMSNMCSKIVKLHQVFETNTEIILVLELAAGGELQRVLDVQEGLGEEDAMSIVKQTLTGLQFLHDRHIAHLDIKPQNILLTSSYPNTDIKICDFGISRIIQKGVEVREIVGTPDYVAPEILSFEPISLKTDIWSIGVLTYVLLTGYSPFTGDNKQQTFCNISQCIIDFPEEYFSNISKEAMDFITCTLIARPGDRPSVQECLQHPWFQSICSRDINCISIHNIPRVSNGTTFPSSCHDKQHRTIEEFCDCKKSDNSLNINLIQATSPFSQVDRSIIC